MVEGHNHRRDAEKTEGTLARVSLPLFFCWNRNFGAIE